MNYIETCKEIIKTPSDFYRKMSTTGGYTDPLTFVAISCLIYGILIVLVHYGMLKINGMYGWDFIFIPMTGMSTIDVMYSWALIIFIYILVAPILNIIFTFITAAVQYPIYKIFGGTGSYEGTVRVRSYSAAVMVLSWIPILGLILSIYSLYLNIVGGMIVHKVSMGKSTVAVLISIVLFAIVAFAAGLIIGGLFFGAIDIMSDQPIRSASQFRDVIINWFMN